MQHIRGGLMFLLALLALTAGCGDDDGSHSAPTPTATSVPTRTPVPLTSADVLAAGPYGAGVTTLTFEDTSRPTMANHGFPGAPTRTLVTEVWYPAPPVPSPPADGLRDAPLADGGAPYPLLVYSHGFDDRRTGGGYLARHLASHGYIVASPDFPLSNFDAPGGPTDGDIPNQPGDVSFVIDRLLALSAEPGGVFSAAVDPDRIALAGLSLGGLTTTLATFHETLRDPRVRAAVSIAGPACFLGPDFYGDRSLPLLIVQGDIDAIVPYRENGRFQFMTANPPTDLVTLHGGSHTAFSEVGAHLIANNPDDVGCVAIGGAERDGGLATNIFDALGGSAAGLIMGDCPPACADPTPRPTALRGARQLDLATAAIFPFLESVLRGDAAMRHYLEATLAAENAEVGFAANP